VNDHACKVVNEKFPDFDLSRLPQFSVSEIVKGKKLGQGCFGIVYEVQNIILQEDQEHQQLPQEKTKKRFRFFSSNRKQQRSKNHEQYGNPQVATDARSFMKLHCRRYKITSAFEEMEGEGECGRNSSNDYDAIVDTRKNRSIRAERRGRLVWCKRRQRHCQARYAIKVLRPEIMEDPTKLYYQGMTMYSFCC
jgi:hypothetical protein